jgi:hypothetical protein
LGKQPVYNDDKRQLSRTLICILTPNDRADNKRRKQQSAVNFAKTRAGELIAKSIAEVSDITDQILPSINFEIPSIYRDGDGSSIMDGVNEAYDPRSARGCILQVEVEDRESSTARRDLGISHFVAIRLSDADAGWWNSDGISCVRIHTTIANLPLLIHDIALDIAMFHSWPYLKETYGSDIDQKIDFSKRKAAFVIEKSRETLYGPINDQELGYFSLATCARTRSGFSAKEYVKLWQEFVNHLLDGRPETDDSRPPGADTGAASFLDPVEQILQFHHQGGQISRRKLTNQLAQLAPGTYLLLMSRKRPGTISARSKLAAFFGKKRYRQGLWIIVPFSDYQSNQNYLPFVSLFKFSVSELSKSAVRK